MKKQSASVDKSETSSSTNKDCLVENSEILSIGKVSPENLRDVYNWSPTKRRKIEKIFSRHFGNNWLPGKRDELVFYTDLLRLLNNEAEKVFSLLGQLDDKQSKGNKNSFNLDGRLMTRLVYVAEKIDIEKTKKLFANEDTTKSFLDFLFQHGHPEFRIVYDSLEFLLEGERNKTMLNDPESLLHKKEWDIQKEDILILVNVLENHIQQLGLGLDIDEQQIEKKITSLREKGRTLRKQVLVDAERYEFKEETWNNWQEFDDYCEKLEKLAIQKSKELGDNFRLIQGLAKIVAGIKVQNRPQRTRRKIEETLRDIVKELECQLNASKPTLLPGEKNPSRWFDWAFSLNEDELEKVQDELNSDYPALSEFLGDCHPDWLVFGDITENNESYDQKPDDNSGTCVKDKTPQVGKVSQNNSPEGGDIEAENLEQNNHSGKMLVEPSEGKDTLSPKDNGEKDTATKDQGEKTTPPDEPLAPSTVSMIENSDKTLHSTKSESARATDITILPKKLFAVSLENGEFVKAYWLALANDVGVNPDLIGALALGTQVRIGTSLPGQLQVFYGALLSADFSKLSSKLLLFSAIIGPIIFSGHPSHEIYTLIQMVDCGIIPVDNLAHFVRTKFIFPDVAIRPEDIDTVLVDDSKDQKLQNLKDKSTEIQKRNIHAEFNNYVPARFFLRHIYREGSELSSIHHAIEHNEVFRKNEIDTILRRFNVEELIDSAPTLGIKQCKVAITGLARKQLARRINDTLSLGREWCAIVGGSTGIEEDGVEKKRLLANLRQYLQQAINAIKTNANEGLEPEIAAASCHCLQTVLNPLEGNEKYNSTSIASLYDEIIPLAAIELDDDFELMPGKEGKLSTCFQNANSAVINLERIFTEFLDRKEFLRARYVLNKNNAKNTFQDRLEQKVVEEQNALHARIKELLNKVEDVYLLGQLDDENVPTSANEKEKSLSHDLLRSSLVGQLESMFAQLKDPSENISWRIRELESKLNEIEKTLIQREQRHNGMLQEEFNRILKQFPDSLEGHEDREYIHSAFQEAIDQDDNIAAFELINRAKEAIQRRVSIPRAIPGRNQELDFFLKNLEQYQDLLRVKNQLGNYIRSIKLRKEVGGINFSQLDKAHLNDVVINLTAWKNLLNLNYQHSSNGEVTKLLGSVTRFLGFGVSNGSFEVLSRSDDLVYVKANLEFPIDSCPIPTFGSSMGKSVHFVISKNKKEPDQIGTFLKRYGLQHLPVFLIYLQEMGLNMRRSYQQYAARKKTSILLIDLCLVFHLCSIRNRLPALFKISLPFSWAQPYLMKGENVPRETFVGREVEVNSIQAPDGACIIFGGRQLGKSALLRYFYREYNNPAKNSYVIYLDIDSLGMPPQPHKQMRDEFWRKIYRELDREGFLEEREINRKKQAAKLEEEVLEKIKGILGSNSEYRLYLLFDESDAFLDMDSTLNFPIVRSLRALMAATNRRFKVVMAGLQSVQRYRNWKNNPFAQLGTDIVVKPLEPEAAQNLILGPLNALGFVFEKNALILRILSQSNYHPGLIQIFCYRLVENLYNRWRGKSSNKIERTIGLEDLQTIERNPEFIEDIRNRFDWTLDLDDRYKVVAYSLVLTKDPTSSRTEREFMSIARGWWPQVFEKMDQQSLRAVLDEMEGLGVLIREDEDNVRKYRLRSPNLLRLLGTREQIEDELQRLISKDAPTTINPRNFHPEIVGERPVLFGPMTKEQEGRIANSVEDSFGITTIFGSIALGINDVPKQLDYLFTIQLEGEGWKKIDVPAQYSGNPEKVVELIIKRLKAKKRKHLFAVLNLSFFPRQYVISDLIDNLIKKTSKLCNRNNHAHVFLLVPPEVSWDWLVNNQRENILHNHQVSSIELQRWSDGAITNALENMGRLALAKALGEDIFDRTYGWHKLLISGFQALPSGISSKSKEDIMDCWSQQVENLRRTYVEDPVSVMKDYGLYIDGLTQLNLVIHRLFDWSFAEENILNRDIAKWTREENAEFNRLLEDDGLNIFKWLRIHDIVLPEKDGQWCVNPVIAEIMKTVS